MRRFSQKNSLVTLSEINIVPLMDLTFVLLIIFVITTPLLEQSMKLDLPSGGEVDPEPLRPDDVATIEIDPAGNMRLDKKPLNLQQIKDALTLMHAQKKDLVIHIRGDENTPYKHIAAVVDVCQKNGMTSLSLQTEFEPKQ